MSNQVSDSYRWMESASMSQPGTVSKDDVIAELRRMVAELRAELAAALEDEKRLTFIIQQSNDGLYDWFADNVWDDLEPADNAHEAIIKTIDREMANAAIEKHQ
jgi:hypothetical protein